MHQLRVLKVIFTMEAKVISMSNNKLIMWDCPVTSQKVNLDVTEFRRTRQSDFICVKLGNFGEFLAAATTDDIVTVWKLDTAEVVLSLPGHTK